MKINPISASAILLALASLTACTHPPTASPPAAEPNSSASKLLMRGQPSGIQVKDFRAQRRNDVLVVQAELINTENSDKEVYWRYRWLDASGMQVGDGDAWKPLKMLGQQTNIVQGTAPTSQVVDFRLEMNTDQLHAHPQGPSTSNN